MRAGSGEADVRDFLKHFPNLSLTDVDVDVANAAAALRAATNLKMPDALVVATGQHWKVGAIVTYDDAWKKKCPTLPIVALGEF